MPHLHRAPCWAFALVWFVNGLLCKVLDLVPRHRAIVARILGEEHAGLLTATIGVLEIGMAVWILTRFQRRFCALAQAGLILAMNVLEFVLAPDLLLFGRLNLLFAAGLAGLILANEFALPPTPPREP